MTTTRPPARTITLAMEATAEATEGIEVMTAMAATAVMAAAWVALRHQLK